jgi:lysophospholipase L1-like esterase
MIDNSDSKAFSILCLGDSFTFGLGADPDNSYPAHLERILNKINHGQRYKVFNGGILGGNSSSILLEQLNSYINKYAPDMIIIMTGMNNTWILSEGTFFHLQEYKKTNLVGTIIKRLDIFLTGLRIYKLFKIAIFNFKYGKINTILKTGLIDVRPTDHNKSPLFSKQKDDINMCLNLYFINGDYDLAKIKIKEAVQDPMFICSVFNIGTVVNFMLWATKGDSRELNKEIGDLKNIIKTRYSQETYREVEEIINLLLNLSSNIEIPQKILKSDLMEIYGITRRNGIHLILQTYPCWAFGLNSVIREASARLGTPLVDNYRIFEEKMKVQNRKDLFAADGHCNAQGYRIVAENIYNVLIQYKFIPNSDSENVSEKDINTEKVFQYD